MATQLQIRRGTSSQVAAFTGAEGEIVVNTTNDSVHVNDGSTAGGFELARADLNNVSDTSLNAALTGNTVSALTITTLTLGSTAITATGAEINILDGVTATAAELNILDGVTSTAAELNILDGVTATTAELNHVDGVTSAIQTQIDAKAPLASPTFTGTVTTAALTGTSATFTTADNSDNLTLTSTDADATTGPNVNFYRNSGSPADNDHLGEIRFTGRNDNSQDVIYANIETRIKDASDGSEDGYFDFETMLNGTLQSRLIMNETGTIFNEDSLDLDFRVESDANTHALFVEGSSGNVGIGTSSPVRNVSIFGSASAVMSFHNSTTGSTISDGFFVGNDANQAYLYNYEATPIVFATSNTERARLDSSGNLLVGSTSLSWTDTDGLRFFKGGAIISTLSGGPPAYFNRRTNDGNIIVLAKDGTTVGSIGSSDGDLAIGTGDCGIRFNDAANAVIPFNITTNAQVDNTLDLGFPTLRWNDAFITNGVTSGSDRNLKQDIEALSDAEQRVAVAAKGLLRKFRWKDAVAEKGDDARIHVGIIAQDLRAAFEAEGLDAARYGMWCSDTWTNDDGSEQTRLSVRYSELLAFIISAI